MTAKFIRHIASILLFSFILALSSCASQTVNTDVNTESEYESESKETEKVSNGTNSSDEANTDEPSFETEKIKNESSESESSATEPQKQYTVSFDLNFDGSPDAKKQQVNEGERADIPTTPVRDGFVFSGWYTDRACTSLFDFSEKTDADITLYALWKGEEYLKDIQEQQNELNVITAINGSLPKIALNEQGSVSFILGKISSIRVSDFASARAALQNVKALLGFSDLDGEYVNERHTQDENGSSFVLQQIFGGYLVYGKQIIVNTDQNGNVTSVSGYYAPQSEKFRSVINITKEDATEIFKRDGYGTPISYDGVRIIYRDDAYDGYAYLFEKSATTVIISAYDGRVLKSFSNLMSALPKEPAKTSPTFGRDQSISTDTFPTVMYELLESGEITYLMHDTLRNIIYHDLSGNTTDRSLPLWEYEYYNTPTLSDADNVWSSPEGMTAALHNLTLCDAYDFYFELLGNNFLPEGVRLLVFINDGSLNVGDAFCSPIIRINDTDTVILSFGSTNDDLFYTVCHELSHATHESLLPNLHKADESGAVAEAYAYVMSRLISLSVRGYADWSEIEYALPGISDGIHERSTAVSKALYRIYKELKDEKLTAKLIYRAWYYMSDTCSFGDYRMAILASATVLGLDEYLGAIEGAFDAEGITPKTITDDVFGKLTLIITDFESADYIENARIAVKNASSHVATELFLTNEKAVSLTLDFGRYAIEIECDGYEKETVFCSVFPTKTSFAGVKLKPLFSIQNKQNS